MQKTAEGAPHTGAAEKRHSEGITSIKHLIRQAGLNQEGAPSKIIGRKCNLVCSAGNVLPGQPGKVIAIAAPCGDTLDLCVTGLRRNGATIDALRFQTGVWSMVPFSNGEHVSPVRVAGIRLLPNRKKPKRRSKKRTKALKSL